MTIRTLLSFLLLLIAGDLCAQYGLYEKGLESYKKDDYPKAVSLFTEYLSKPLRNKKIDVDVYYYKALAYYKQKDYKNAINDFQEAILQNRDNKGNIYWFMAKADLGLDAYEDAVSDYTNALKEMSADNIARSKLYFERSQVYAKTGNATAVLDDLNSSVAMDASNVEAARALDKMNVQTASTRTVGGDKKEVPPTGKPAEKKNLTADNTKQDLKKAEEKKAEDKKAEDKRLAALAQTKAAEKIPVVAAQPEVQAPVVPAAPTLADLYKDERRYALVIGNSKYSKEVGVLKNPVNDATDIAKELRASNFDVMLLTDATYGQMRANMLKFKEKVDAGDRDKTVALFYYAGHGLQYEDENYLVPVDASLEFADDIGRYCFPIQKMVLANMERSNSRMNIVILDACRNSPFPALNRSAGGQGLGEMKRARGSFIAYATAPGSVAADGDGRNGLYTQELLKAMRKPAITIEQVFKEVRLKVLRRSGDRQNTWDSSNIVGDFYFKF